MAGKKPAPTPEELDRKVMSLMSTLDALGAMWMLVTLAATPALVVGLYRWAF